MAKQKKFSMDPFSGGSDMELDLPDFDFGPSGGNQKDDRKPVTKFTQGFVKGAKSQLTSGAVIRQTIKKVLPAGYGEAMEFGDQLISSGKNLYNDAANITKPLLNDSRRAVQKIIPAAEKYLPKKAADILKEFSKTDSSPLSFFSKDDFRNSELERLQAEIFQFNTEQNNRHRVEDEVRERMRDAIDQKRFSTTAQILDQMRIATIQNTAFNTKVGAAYMRKSLELQYRQYYATVDMLEEAKTTNVKVLRSLEAVVKNTGLPDYAKLKTGEYAEQLLRNKIVNSLAGNIFKKRDQFFENLTNTISKNLLSRVKGAVGIGREASSLAGMADGMGIDGVTQAGRAAGQLGAGSVIDALLGRFAPNARRYLEQNQTLRRGGNAAGFYAQNVPQLLERWARSRTDQFGLKGRAIDFGKDMLRGINNVDTTVGVDKRGNLDESAYLNRRTLKTINEILPGYLSRIERELRIIRTGDQSAQLITYDYDRNRFDHEGAVSRNTLSKLFDPVSKGNVSTEIERALDKIDPQKKLSPEQRKLLGRELVRGNAEGKVGDAETLTNRLFYQGDAAKHGVQFAGLFKDYYKNDKDGAKRAEFNTSYRNLGRSADVNKERIQQMIDSGQLGLLENLGIVKQGRIDMTAVYDYFADRPISEQALYQLAEQKGVAASMGGVRGPDTNYNTTNTRTFNRTINNITNGESSGSGLNSEEVLQAIRENNSRDVLEATRDALMRIEDRLANGMYMQGGLGGDAPINKEGATQSMKTPWWKMPLWKAPFAAGRGAARTAANGFRAYLGAANRTGKAVNKVLSGIGTAGLWGAGKIWNSGIIGGIGKLGLKAGKGAIRGLGAADDVLNTARDAITKAVPTVYGVGKAGVMGAVNMLRVPKDVYTNRMGFKNPTLYAEKFKAGQYKSARTGKVLARPSEIDGPVLDENDNVVLTEEDVRDGLLDVYGKKMKFGAALFASKLGSVAGLGVRSLFRGIGAADSVLNGALNFAKGMLGSIIGPNGVIMVGGKTMVTRLTEIRDILDARLPKSKGNVFGDADGDGIRDNSAADLDRKDKEKAKSKQEAEDRKQQQLGFGKMSGFGALGGIFGKLFGKKGGGAAGGGDEEDKDSGLGDAAKSGIGAYIASKLPGLGGIGKGILGAGKGLLGMGSGFLGKALGIGSVAYGAKSVYDLATGQSQNKLMDGLTAGMGAFSLASLVGGGSALAGAGTLLTGAGTLGAGLLTLLSSPIALGAAAVAGVGYGAYKLYQFATKKRLTTLSKVRAAQYGILPDDKDHADALFKLEDKLQKYVEFDGDTPKLNIPKDLKAKELVDGFDVDPGKDKEMAIWIDWFMRRFKPVFMKHLQSLHEVDPKTDLGDVEKLKYEDKKKYLSKAAFPDGPYGVKISPFKDLKELPVDAEGVAKLVEATDKKLDEENKSATEKNKVDANAVAAAAGVAAGSPDSQGSGLANSEGKATDLPAADPNAGALSKDMDADGSGGAALAGTVGSGVTYSATAGVDVGAYTSGSQGTIDAITAIRYKTYGLTEMDTIKVRALDSLEVYLGPQLKYGTTGQATWEGSVDDVIKAIGPSFGVTLGTPGGYNFSAWFRLRFLPVFLNWATILKKKTNRANPVEANTAVRDQDRLDIAMAIITTKTNYSGSSVSVWMVPTSPWAGYTLNEDVKSTDDNVAGLRELAKKLVANEESKSSSGLKKDAADKAADAKALGEAGVKKDKGFWAKLFGGGDDDKEGGKTGGGGVTGWFKNLFGGSKGSGMKDDATGYSSDMGGGNEIAHPGKGTGGDVNSLPKPTGNKSYAAVKDLIEAVAKMAGVDPKLMTTMAAIESGFNWQVKAPTSSASGLYQFINSTWKMMLDKYGSKYGIAPGTTQLDPRANALMGAEFLKENMAALKGAVDRPLTDTDLYLAHFMGAGGARKFLKADPKAIAADVFPAEARANVGIFYSNGKALTIGQVYQKLNNLVKTKGGQFGAGFKDGSEQLTNSTAGGSAATADATAKADGQTPQAQSSTTGSSSPDVSADGSGRAMAKPTAQASASSDGAGPDAAAQVMGSGFDMNTPKVQAAQAQRQKETTDPALTAAGSQQAMSQLIQINTDMRDYLKTIAEAVSKGGGLAGGSSATSDSSSREDSRRSATGPGVGAPRAPISLAKSR
jgi:hypothetical protein